VTTRSPRDPETLERLLAQREAELLEARLLIEKLKLEVLRAKRDKYGASSERLKQLQQLELLVEELESERERVHAMTPAKPDGQDSNGKGQEPGRGRKPLPEHVPRETQVHQPDNAQRCGCPGCDGTLRWLGEDVSEVLEIVPARFKVVRHVRPKYSCAKCHTIVQAAAPSRPIVRGLAGVGLLAHVLTSKFADHIPLYRQSEIYAREGVDLERSTLAGMVGGCAARGQPDERRRIRQQQAAPRLQALKGWMDQTLAVISHKSDLGKAIVLGQALGGADALRRRRTNRDRQLGGRAGPALRRAGAQQSLVRELGHGRRARRRHVQPDRHRQAQRPGSSGVSASRARAHRRAPHQPHRRVAAVERGHATDHPIAEQRLAA
jgi:transposase